MCWQCISVFCILYLYNYLWWFSLTQIKFVFTSISVFKKIADEKNSVNFHYNLILISHNSSFQLVTAILSMTLGQECLAWVFFLCWSILATGSPSLSYIGKAQSSLKCPNQIAAQPAFYCFVHETQEQAPYSGPGDQKNSHFSIQSESLYLEYLGKMKVVQLSIWCWS